MRTVVAQDRQLSPSRVLEMLVDRFGAFEARCWSLETIYAKL